MKTLEEFVQRLQDDAAFEKQAQTFETGEALMAFVKREGYDFTLEQLALNFKQTAKPPTEAGGMASAPADTSASTPPRPDDPVFSRKPAAFPNAETSAALLERGSGDFTPEQPEQGLQNPKGEMPSHEPAGNSPEEFCRAGGGRHRGFSPQRLKSVLGEDP